MRKQHRPGLARARKSAGLSQERLAEVLRVDRSTVTRWECAATEPQPWLRPKLARALGLRPHELDEVLSVIEVIEEPADDVAPSDKRTALSAATSNDLKVAVWQGISSLSVGDEHEALELARRVAASDVSAETLSRLEGIVDELAVKYQKTPPQELLGPVRRHVSYVMRLLDARMTLEEHRRLLIVGG